MEREFGEEERCVPMIKGLIKFKLFGLYSADNGEKFLIKG